MRTDTQKALCKLLKGDYRNESSIQLVKRVEGLIEALRKEREDLKVLLSANTEFNGGLFDTVDCILKERDDALKLRESYNSNVEDWRELCGYFNLPVSELSSVMKAIDTMRLERDDLRSQIGEITKMLVESSMMRRNINSSVQALIEIATAPDTTQPQLNEIRYVLHGDIQPCTVLYSDDTTTLLRLDEGDIMCETDTIEWSDSVTYRCQELLREAGVRSLGHVAPRLAQLVRDERILLNDNGDDGTVETFVPTLDERTQPVDPSDTPFMRHSPVQER